MKRFSLIDGEMVEDPAGEWAQMTEVREFALVAARVGRDHDRYAKALARIAGVPVTLPLRRTVSVAREALEGPGDA